VPPGFDPFTVEGSGDDFIEFRSLVDVLAMKTVQNLQHPVADKSVAENPTAV
jgi:hypothetical protein